MKTKNPTMIMAVATLASGVLAAVKGNFWSTLAVLFLALATVVMYLANLSSYIVDEPDEEDWSPENVSKHNREAVKKLISDLSNFRDLIGTDVDDHQEDEDTELIRKMSEEIKLDGTHIVDADALPRTEVRFGDETEAK